MSDRQPWPYAMKEHRDRTAELLSDAKQTIERLGAAGALRDSTEWLKVYQCVVDALRHMEKAGAPTEPQ